MRSAATILALVAACVAAGRASAAEPRLGPSSLVYQGAFRLPAQVSDRQTFAYGGTALAYNPARHSLFVVGHDWYQLTAEVTIPRARKSAQVSGLRRAAFLQPFTDATGGKADTTGGDNNKIGGQLVFGGRLVGTVYVYYDAAGQQVVSHWSRASTSLSGAPPAGLFQVGRLGAGVVSGFMAEVPPAWRARMGGPVLTGNCCIPIISRTSFGPAAFAFDPAKLGAAASTPSVPLLYYPSTHPAIGAWDASWNPAGGIFFGGGTTIRGVVFPRGGRSVLYFGTQGIGRFCYGEARAIAASTARLRPTARSTATTRTARARARMHTLTSRRCGPTTPATSPQYARGSRRRGL